MTAVLVPLVQREEKMLLLTNEDVVNALSIEECMAAVEESLRRLAQGKLVRWDGRY